MDQLISARPQSQPRRAPVPDQYTPHSTRRPNSGSDAASEGDRCARVSGSPFLETRGLVARKRDLAGLRLVRKPHTTPRSTRTRAAIASLHRRLDTRAGVGKQSCSFSRTLSRPASETDSGRESHMVRAVPSEAREHRRGDRRRSQLFRAGTTAGLRRSAVRRDRCSRTAVISGLLQREHPLLTAMRRAARRRARELPPAATPMNIRICSSLHGPARRVACILLE